MNRGPELSKGPDRGNMKHIRQQNSTPTYWKTTPNNNVRVVHTRLSIAGDAIWEHKKHHNSWRLGLRSKHDCGSLTAFPKPAGWWGGGSCTLPKTHPTLGPKSTPFRLRALALWASQRRRPNLLSNHSPPEPFRPSLLFCQTATESTGIFNLGTIINTEADVKWMDIQ